jgi:CheY-like chemotaxis protein
MLEGSAPYMLVADANDERAALCVGVAKRFGVRTAVARSSHHALSVIAQSGLPAVLTVDLSLPPTDGFAVIDALGDDRRTEIIAWSASREITEYAASRPHWPKAHVFSDRAAPSTIQLTVEKLVRRHAADHVSQPGPAAPGPEHADKIMNALAEKTRQLCDTAGVAVYLKARGDTGFRTVLHWTSEEALPHLPYAVPHAVNRVIESGRPIVGRDRRVASPSHELADEALDETTRGLAAVPIMFDGETIGAICVFDVEPLVLDDRAAAALVALGRDAFSTPPVPAPLSVEARHAAPFRDRAVDRRRDSAARLIGQTEQPSEWPPTILERKGGEFAVARELARARREGRQLSVVLFDVRPAAAAESPAQSSPQEHVEAVSDTLLRAIRQSDLPIRWGVSELLVVLPGLKGTEARSVAERVRAALQAGAGHRLSVSGGVAELETDERFADVVERARQKVAMAVGRGHNRVL